MKKQYLKAIVILHGKSELQIFKFIKSNLRLKIEQVSEKNGEKSIQIASLMNVLNNTKFKNQKMFLKNYEDVEWNFNEKCITDSFKIFIIMDTDDCATEDQRENYINKKMFESHWAYNHIIPIFNTPELETILMKAKIPFTKKGEKRKAEYVKIFPTDDKYIQQNRDYLQLEDVMKKLKKNKDTNLDEFIEFCLNLVNK